MSKNKDVDLLSSSRSDMHGVRECRGCGGTDDLCTISFRIGWNAMTTMCWCERCRLKIAKFLLNITHIEERHDNIT